MNHIHLHDIGHKYAYDNDRNPLMTIQSPENYFDQDQIDVNPILEFTFK